MWDLYKFQPSFVLGFHGCDKAVAEHVLASTGKQHLRRSTNRHDWLGNGIYFWESSPQRAMEWVHALMLVGEEALCAIAGERRFRTSRGIWRRV